MSKWLQRLMVGALFAGMLGTARAGEEEEVVAPSLLSEPAAELFSIVGDHYSYQTQEVMNRRGILSASRDGQMQVIDDAKLHDLGRGQDALGAIARRRINSNDLMMQCYEEMSRAESVLPLVLWDMMPAFAAALNGDDDVGEKLIHGASRRNGGIDQNAKHRKVAYQDKVDALLSEVELREQIRDFLDADNRRQPMVPAKIRITYETYTPGAKDRETGMMSAKRQPPFLVRVALRNLTGATLHNVVIITRVRMDQKRIDAIQTTQGASELAAGLVLRQLGASNDVLRSLITADVTRTELARPEQGTMIYLKE